MTDIAITYEDGLRLSELQGQLAQLQYDLNHIGMTTLGDKAAACALMLAVVAIFAMIALWILDMMASDRDPVYFSVTVGGYLAVAVVSIILFAVLCYFATGYVEQLKVIEIESDMTNIQGQMDAIYAKYGGA